MSFFQMDDYSKYEIDEESKGPMVGLMAKDYNERLKKASSSVLPNMKTSKYCETLFYVAIWCKEKSSPEGCK